MTGTYIRTEAHRRALAERAGNLNRKYPKGWDTTSRIYRIWRCMYFRCYQKTHVAQPRYQRNGITICDEWTTYRPFMEWAQKSGYRDDLQIDRRDNTLGYSPTNCRWVTARQNSRNRRNSLGPLPAFDELKTPLEWAEDSRNQVSARLAYRRIVEFGWQVERALAKGLGPGWWGDPDGHAISGRMGRGKRRRRLPS